MKIFFNRVEKYEPWGGGTHFLTSLCNYLRERNIKVTFHLEDDVDLIFMIDPRPGDIGYSINHILDFKARNPSVKILHRINECDARKNTNFMDQLLIESALYADKVVFISEWLKNYFTEKGMNTSNASVVYNGCKLDHFYPENKTINLNKNKVKLVTHHWSDNWMKGHDLYKFIDQNIVGKDYEFTYVGRYCKDYNPVNTAIIKPMWGPSLGEEIRKHDIYVTASRFEPCGMHHIEGAASGLPVIYHQDCGGINELCKNHGEEYKDFKEKLRTVTENLEIYKNKINYDYLDINRCCEMFFREIKLLLN